MKQLHFELLLSIFLSISLLCCAVPYSRIVGGDDAVVGQVPYLAALFIGGIPTCGVVILNEQYALTGMQCVCSQNSDKPWPPQLFTVRVGSIDLYSGEPIILEKITVKSNYSEFRTGIAILKLSKPVTFSEKVQAVQLAYKTPPVNAIVEVSGWGRVNESDENMQRKMQINVGSVMSAEDCYRFIEKSDNQVFCLSHPRKNGICRGDFGGPAVYQGKLVGIAAYTLGECGGYLPDVFASIASNYEWIENQIEDI